MEQHVAGVVDHTDCRFGMVGQIAAALAVPEQKPRWVTMPESAAGVTPLSSAWDRDNARGIAEIIAEG